MSGMYGYEGDGSAAPSYGGGGYAAGNYSRGGGGGGYADNSLNRGSGRGSYQGGDWSGGRGGGHGGGSGRDGDWICPNTSCGNSNFARRTECNRCGTLSPASRGEHGNFRGGGYNSNQSGNFGGGKIGNYDGGKNVSYGGNKERDGGSRGGSYGDHQERDVDNRGGSYGVNQERDDNDNNTNSGNRNYGTNAVPPPTSYIGGPNSYPPSYGGPVSYAGENMGSTRGGGRFGGYDRGYNSQQEIPDEAPVKVKQCNENCDETCDNSRIYISNLPLDVTVEELRDLFGGIGQVGRIKQKRGYKDQWPWNIKLYTDDNGKNKGDAVLSYEDPSAAHSAGGFYNGYVMRGCTIKVAMAEKSALKAPLAQSGRGGGRGGYSGGGDRRSYNNRDDRGGPDRNRHGGNRSQPY